MEAMKSIERNISKVVATHEKTMQLAMESNERLCRQILADNRKERKERERFVSFNDCQFTTINLYSIHVAFHIDLCRQEQWKGILKATWAAVLQMRHLNCLPKMNVDQLSWRDQSITTVSV